MSAPAPSNPTTIVAMALLCEGGLALLAVILGWFLQRPPWDQIEVSVPALGHGFLASGPLLAGLLLINGYPWGPLKQLQTLVQRWLVPIFRPCGIGQLLLISVLAGVGEEMLFRGTIQAGVQQISSSPALALAVASVLFGLAHPISATYVVLAGAVGAYLGWLWLSTGNLLVPIVAHAAYDFAALIYLLQRDPPPPD